MDASDSQLSIMGMTGITGSDIIDKAQERSIDYIMQLQCECSFAAMTGASPIKSICWLSHFWDHPTRAVNQQLSRLAVLDATQYQDTVARGSFNSTAILRPDFER